MVFEQFLFEQKKTNGRQDLFLNGKSHKKNPFFLTFPLILCHHQGDVIYTAKKPAHICYAITEIIRFQWYDHRAESCLLWKSVLDEIRFILCMLLGGLACCFHFYRNCQFHFHSCLLWKSVLGGWGGEVRWVAQFVFPLSPPPLQPTLPSSDPHRHIKCNLQNKILSAQLYHGTKIQVLGKRKVH